MFPQELEIGFFDTVNALFKAYKDGDFVTASFILPATGQVIDDVALVSFVDVFDDNVKLSDVQLSAALSGALLTIRNQFGDEFIKQNPDLFYANAIGSNRDSFLLIKCPYQDVDFEFAKLNLERIQLLMQEGPIMALQEEPYPVNRRNPLDALEGYSVFLGPFVGNEDEENFFEVLRYLASFHNKPMLDAWHRHRANIFGDIFSVDRRDYKALFDKESDPSFHILSPDEPGAVMGVQAIAYEM